MNKLVCLGCSRTDVPVAAGEAADPTYPNTDLYYEQAVIKLSGVPGG